MAKPEKPYRPGAGSQTPSGGGGGALIREVLATGTILGAIGLVTALASHRLSTAYTIALALFLAALGTLALGMRFRFHQKRAKLHEDTHRITVDQPLMGFAHADLEGNWTFVNPGFCRLLGYSSKELLGRNFAEFTHPSDLEQDDRLLRQFLAGQINRCEVEKRFVTKGGGQVWVIMSAVLANPGGQKATFIATFQDITELKETQRRLAQSEDLYRRVFEQANIGMALVEVDGTFRKVNRPLWDKLQYTPAELTGKTFQEITHPEDLDIDLELVNALIFGRQDSYRLTKRYIAKDGTTVWALLAVALLRDDTGAPECFLAIILDISDFKLVQQELEDSNRQLQDFAHIISHDLREPLRGMANYTAILQEDYGDRFDSTGREMLNTLSSLARRQDKQIQALLAYSRLGNATLERRPTDLNEVLSGVYEDLAHLLEEHNALLLVDRPLPTLECDGRLVADVFSNLIRNGLQYNDNDAKHIEVGYKECWPPEKKPCAPQTKLRSGGPGPVLFVRDDGIGIAPEHQDKIFTVFKRLHGVRKYGPGSGMGLALAQRIIQRHGGQMCLESAPGQGSTFLFTLGDGKDAK